MSHSKTRWGGLRIKLIAWFLVPTAIILSIVAAFTFDTYQRVTEDLVIERNQELTRLLANQLAVDLAEYARQLDVVAATAEVYRYRADPMTQKTILRLSPGPLWDFDGGVLILDQSGTVMAADQRRLETIGQDWSHRAYFQQAQQVLDPSSSPVFSNIVSDGPDGVDVVVAAVPNRSPRNEFSGVSVGLFRVSVGPETKASAFYNTIFRKLDQVGSDTIYLVDGNGQVIYHADTWLIGQDMSGLFAVQQALDGRTGGIHTTSPDGREIVACFAPVPGTSWGLVTEEGWDDLIATSQRYGRLLLLLLGAGIIVPAIVIAIGARQITLPIANLIGAAQNVTSGDFEVIQIKTGDELEALAEQFNQMSAQVQESYAHLEQRVADRTRELAALNSIASVVSRSLDLEEVLCSALRKTLEVTGLDVGAAYRLEEDRETLTLITSQGLSEDFAAHVSQVSVWHSAAGPAMEAQRPIIVPVQAYPASELKAAAEREGVKIVIGVPLIAKGEVVGAINLGSRVARDVTEEEMSLLEAIGQQTGIAVENARLYDQAEETAVTAERHRLARDLHDAVTQTLFSASMIAEVLPRIWERNPDEGRRRLEELHQLTRGALAEMRTLLVELRPSALVEAPLSDLLRQLGEAFMGRTRVPVTLNVDTNCTVSSEEVKVALYRIAQEALNNVSKHANASQVTIGLYCTDDRVEMSIQDDGCGFDPTLIPLDHLGVGIMHERARAVGATLCVESQTGHGTSITTLYRRPGRDAGTVQR